MGRLPGIEKVDLGTIGYHEALAVQQKYFDSLLAAKRGGGEISGGERNGCEMSGDESGGPGRAGYPAGNKLILCSHPHVYTIGRSGDRRNMLAGDGTLEKVGAQLIETGRGGDITYHGPGQLVGYPILDLEQFGLGVKEYIHAVEETVIRTLHRWGIDAGRLRGATGVWLEGQRKICAIGVKVSRWVTMHGFALNVSTDLTYFGYINPCGFTDKGVTSMEKETENTVSQQEVKEVLVGEFRDILGC